MNKKEYMIPIRQSMSSEVLVEANSYEEAVDMVSEMSEDEMGYPFDFMSPSIEVDPDDDEIKKYNEGDIR